MKLNNLSTTSSCSKKLSLVNNSLHLYLNQSFWPHHLQKWQSEILNVWNESTKKSVNTSPKWPNPKCLTKLNKWLKDSSEKSIKRKYPLIKPFSIWADLKTHKNHKTNNYLQVWSHSCTLNWGSMPVTLKQSLWSQPIFLLELSMKISSKKNCSRFSFKF